MTELKPCPFCGGKAFLYVDDGICVICKDCEAKTVVLRDLFFSGKGTSGNSTQSVIDRWNMRINDE